jgi:hypothetical protein
VLGEVSQRARKVDVRRGIEQRYLAYVASVPR